MLKQKCLLPLILSVSVFSFSAYAVASNERDNTEMLLFDDVQSVFSASKYEQKVTEAPARINIVTAKEIESYGYQSLADILRSVPGFYTSYDRNYSYTGVRGFGIPGDYDTRIRKKETQPALVFALGSDSVRKASQQLSGHPMLATMILGSNALVIK